jgi:hypothetical protein
MNAPEVRLPPKFTTGGFDLALLFKQGNYCIHSRSQYGEVVAYQAAILQHEPGAKLSNGHLTSGREIYPAKFWVCGSLASAHERLDSERRCLQGSTKGGRG